MVPQYCGFHSRGPPPQGFLCRNIYSWLKKIFVCTFFFCARFLVHVFLVRFSCTFFCCMFFVLFSCTFFSCTFFPARFFLHVFSCTFFAFIVLSWKGTKKTQASAEFEIYLSCNDIIVFALFFSRVCLFLHVLVQVHVFLLPLCVLPFCH